MGDYLKRLKSDLLADQARDMIRAAIFEGRIKPEEKLTIEHIAAQLGISRTPVREALKALENDGIVRMLPNRGAVVQSFSRVELADRYTVRATLEGLAGELACHNEGKKLAVALATNHEKLVTCMNDAQPDDLQTASNLVALNIEFHDAILLASRSPTTVRLLATLRMPLAYRLYHWRDAERQRLQADFHARIIEAFQQEDAVEVRRRLQWHILESRDYLMGSEVDPGEAS